MEPRKDNRNKWEAMGANVSQGVPMGPENEMHINGDQRGPVTGNENQYAPMGANGGQWEATAEGHGTTAR